MNALIVTPDRNRDGSDWSGAFAVEARRLCEVHQLAPGAVRLSINISRPPADQRQQLLDALSQAQDLDLVAILCHGWRGGIQVGWDLRTVGEFARALAAAGAPGLVIVLYACSTETDAKDRPGTAGDGGFADMLRDALCRVRPDWQGWVDGHTTSGHCVRNPNVRRMEGLACTTSGACTGGDWLIAPGSALWSKWDATLHDKASTLRLRYPLMTRAQITAELGG